MITIAEKKNGGASVSPKRKVSAMAKASSTLITAAQMEAAEVLRMLNTSPDGLDSAAVAERLEKFGPNEVAREEKHGWLKRLYTAVRNPLVILLTVLAIVTFATARESSDYTGGVVMLLMVVLGVSLRFVQETKADSAAAKLKAMINVTATVVR